VFLSPLCRQDGQRLQPHFSPNATQFVQQGIERYKTGDVQGAIASEQTALTAYQTTNNHANQAIVREKLAIAYQLARSIRAALDHWKQALANLSKQGDFPKVGRLLTELAINLQPIGTK
jgi:tetratricopeptide (TPR) repeat protein